MADIVLELPVELRSELKTPLGPVYTDAESLRSDAGSPLAAVGDIVTYHLLSAGRTPDAALVDERTKRSAVESEVREAIEGFDRRVSVANPAGTLSRALVEALRAGIDSDGTTLVDVDGEEDLAALPAVLAVPAGGSVVYGQPDEGMVLVTPDEGTRERARSLLSRMDGESDAVITVAEGR